MPFGQRGTPIGATDVCTKFAPKENISVFELATILANLTRVWGKIIFTAEQWDALDPSLKQHFSRWEEE